MLALTFSLLLAYPPIDLTQAAVGEPPPSALAQLKALEDRPSIVLRSAVTPLTMARFRSRNVTLFEGLAEGPSLLIAPTINGSAAIPRGQALPGRGLMAPWLVVSFAGCTGFETFDVPFLIVLQHRPAEVMLTGDGLALNFTATDTGYLAWMPLFGHRKLPQPGNNFAVEHWLPNPDIYPYDWRENVPDELGERAAWWASCARAFPIGLTERYAVDLATDTLTLRQDYEWLLTTDDWNTPRRKFAALPPTLALAMQSPSFPGRADHELIDPDYPTNYGPYVGAEGVDRIEIRLPLLQYVNEAELLTRPTESSAALQRLDQAMAGKFRSADQWQWDHGGRNNFCWNIVGDVWYTRGIPLTTPDIAAKAKGSLRKYLADEVLVAQPPYKEFEGHWLLHGPGIGSWGTWGDAAKFSTNALQAIWGYGQFTGDWDLLRSRWEFIQKLFCTPHQMDWAGFGRHSIAELGDIAPPCASYARLGYRLGDADAYLLGCYAYAKNLTNMHVMQTGGDYFYRLQPYHGDVPMPEHIKPTNLWGDTAGWMVDSPKWGDGEHQTNNRWVRFHDPDTGRYYRDHLADAVREELADPDYLARFEQHRNKDDAHIMTSLVRVTSLTLDAPLAELTAICEPDQFKGGGPGMVAAMYSYLRASQPHEPTRLVPHTGRSPWIVSPVHAWGHEEFPALAVSGAWSPELSWFGWKGAQSKGERVRFGKVVAFEGEAAETGEERMGGISAVGWAR